MTAVAFSSAFFFFFKNKWHDNILKNAHKSLKSSIFNVQRVHLDLIIATEAIHKGKKVMQCRQLACLY